MQTCQRGQESIQKSVTFSCDELVGEWVKPDRMRNSKSPLYVQSRSNSYQSNHLFFQMKLDNHYFFDALLRK